MPAPDDTPSASGPGFTQTQTAYPLDPAAEFPFLAPPAAAGELGRLGKYRVRDVLGRGGMGVVFRAEDPGLQREIALKVMLPQFAGNPMAKARFVREGRAAAKVEHDHILPIFAVDEDRGVPFIAMPLLKGMPLGAALRAARPPLGEVLRVGREIAEGLAAAHEKGLVHRDVKPANVWLEGGKRRVKILDFGLARVADAGAGGDEPQTASGAVLGTPAYMSPEQANGEAVDARTDLFSLGVILYEMTTGRRPFTGNSTLAVLSALAMHHPPPPAEVAPDCPPLLSHLVMALLAKTPAQRPGSAAWVAEELGRVDQTLSVMLTAPVPLAEPVANDPWADIATTAGPPPVAAPAPAAPPGPPARRSGVPVAWAVAAVLVAAVGGAAAWLLTRPPAAPPDDLVSAPDRPTPPTSRPTPRKEMPTPAAVRTAVEAIHPYAILALRMADNRQGVSVRPADPLPAGAFTLDAVAMELRPPAGFPFNDHVLTAIAGQSDFTSFTDYYGVLEWSEAEFARLADTPVAGTLDTFQTGLAVTPNTVALLKKFPRLREIGLAAGRADDALLDEFAKARAWTGTCIVRDLGQFGKVTAKGWAAVAKFPVASLRLVNPAGPDREACAALATMPELNSLAIDGGTLDTSGVRELAKCPKLTYLGLSSMKLGGAGQELAALPRLVTLSAPASGLTDADVAHLARSRTLRFVSLDNTAVSAGAAAKLRDALPRCQVQAAGQVFEPADVPYREAVRLLTRGQFSLAVTTAKGEVKTVTAIADLPDEVFSLTGVRFAQGANPPFGDDDLKRLEATPTLVDLSTPYTKFGPAGLRSLLPSKATLTILYLAGTPLTDEHLEAVDQLTALENVHVGADGWKLTDAGIARLAALPRLRYLFVPGTGLTDAGLKPFAARPIEELDVGDTRVTDAGLETVAGMKALRALSVANTAVSDAGVPTLARMTGLKSLYLLGSRVSQAGYDKLAAARPDCKIIWEDPNRVVAKWLLGRPGFEVGVQPAGGTLAEVKTAGGLPAGPFTLVWVRQQPTQEQLGPADIRRMAAAPEITQLHLWPGAAFTDEAAREVLAWKDTLLAVHLASTGITDEGVRAVAGLRKLGSANLAGNRVTDAGVKHLAGLDLNWLSLWGTDVTDAGVQHLAGMKNLTSLSLVKTAVSDASVVTLSGLKALKTLSLVETRVTRAGYEALRKALPECEITWEDSNLAVAKWLLERGGFKVVVRAGGADVTAAKADDLPAGPFTLVGVHRDGITPPLTDADLKRFEATPTLREYVVADHPISAAGLRSLFASKDTLTNLYLAGVPVADEHLEVIARFPKLEALFLGPGGPKVTDAGIARLAACPRLAALDLSGTGLTDAGRKLLAALPLTTLHVSDTGLTDAAADTLAGVKTLKNVRLTGTRMTAAGVGKLKAALPGCEVAWDDPNRAGAGWWLSVPGRGVIVATPDGKPESSRESADALPPGPFTVVGLTKKIAAPFTDADARRVTALPAVRHLQVGYNQLTADGFAALAAWDAPLTLLGLQNSALTDADLKRLARHTGLKQLMIGRTRVTDAGLEHLAPLAGLESLHAEFNPGVTDAGLKHLAKLPGLRNVGLSSTGVTDAGVGDLARLTGLVSLNVAESGVTAAGVKALRAALPKCRVAGP